jgi:hypothetical protein
MQVRRPSQPNGSLLRVVCAAGVAAVMAAVAVAPGRNPWCRAMHGHPRRQGEAPAHLLALVNVVHALLPHAVGEPLLQDLRGSRHQVARL